MSDHRAVMKEYTVILDADGDMSLLDDEHRVWSDGDDLDDLLTRLQVIPGTKVFISITVMPIPDSVS